MFQSWKLQRLILTLIILIVVIYIIYKFTPSNDKLEYFESNTITANTIAHSGEHSGEHTAAHKTNEYLKLGETYLDDSDKNLKLNLLYANYSGEEANKDNWSNKTLSQCTDTCNKLDSCVGFSRDIVGDDEPAICYPRTAIDKCHSYRKGSFSQRQHALAYNTYIKSSTQSALTKCLGDSKLTLGRTIYIKSYAHPDRYIGLTTNGEIGLIQRNESGVDFGKAAQFVINSGMDGSGTVSFQHLATGIYIYRDSGDMIVGKTLSVSDGVITTEDKQRASFNIEDGMSNNIVIKCLPLQLENTDRYVSVYPKNNKFLNVRAITDLDIENTEHTVTTAKRGKKLKMITFEIVDIVVSSSIIDSRKYIKNVMEPMRTYPATPNRQIATTGVVAPIIRKYPADNLIQSFTDVSTGTSTGSSTGTIPTVPLDMSMDNYNYYKLLNGSTNQKDLENYVHDKYLDNQQNDNMLKIQSDLIANLNTSHATSSIGDATQKAMAKYASLKAMNSHIESMLNTDNTYVESTSNKLTNNLDKMKIQDLSKDYFFLKNLSS